MFAPKDIPKVPAATSKAKSLGLSLTQDFEFPPLYPNAVVAPVAEDFVFGRASGPIRSHGLQFDPGNPLSVFHSSGLEIVALRTSRNALTRQFRGSTPHSLQSR
jgi:hypothetical protein